MTKKKLAELPDTVKELVNVGYTTTWRAAPPNTVPLPVFIKGKIDGSIFQNSYGVIWVRSDNPMYKDIK